MVRLTTEKGLTLTEILISTLILIPVFVSVMYVFIQCMELSETAANSTTAVWASQDKITEIENAQFSQIFGTYNNTDFTTQGLNGRGAIYIDNSNTDILEITVSFSWQQKKWKGDRRRHQFKREY